MSRGQGHNLTMQCCHYLCWLWRVVTFTLIHHGPHENVVLGPLSLFWNLSFCIFVLRHYTFWQLFWNYKQHRWWSFGILNNTCPVNNFIRNLPTFHTNIYIALFVSIKYIHFYITLILSITERGLLVPTVSTVSTTKILWSFVGVTLVSMLGIGFWKKSFAALQHCTIW